MEKEEEILVCANCGKPLDPGVKFCPECGTKVAPQKLVCSACGMELNPSVKFCPECGTKVGEEAMVENPLLNDQKKTQVTKFEKIDLRSGKNKKEWSYSRDWEGDGYDSNDSIICPKCGEKAYMKDGCYVCSKCVFECDPDEKIECPICGKDAYSIDVDDYKCTHCNW